MVRNAARNKAANSLSATCNLPTYDDWIRAGASTPLDVDSRSFRHALSIFVSTLNAASSKDTKAVKARWADFLAAVDSHSVRSSSGTQSLPSYALDVLAHIRKVPEEKASMDLLDVLVRRYTVVPTLNAAPDLYGQLIRYVDRTDGSHGRRLRMASSILEKHAIELGIDFAKLRNVPERDAHASLGWQAWSSSWLPALADEMRSSTEAGRAAISQHLTGLLVLAPAALRPLLQSVSRNDDDFDPSVTLRSALLVLVAAKSAGLCSIAAPSSRPNSISVLDSLTLDAADAGANGVPSGLAVDLDIMMSCARASAPEVFLSALSIAVESRYNTSAISEEESAVVKDVFASAIASTDARTRQGLLSTFVRLLNRLISGGLASARDVARLRNAADTEQSPSSRALLQKAEGDIHRHRGFLTWTMSFAKRYIRPNAPYPPLILSLHLLQLTLGAGVDPSYRPISSMPKAGAGMACEALQQRHIDGELVQQLLDCASSTFFEVQDLAFSLLSGFPAPLPSLERQQDAEAAILFRAAHAMNTARECDSAAAAGLLRLYDDIYLKKLKWGLPSLEHVFRGSSNPDYMNKDRLSTLSRYSLHQEVLAYITQQLASAQSTHGEQSGLQFPVHGGLLTAQKLLGSVTIHKETSAQEVGEVLALYKHAQDIVLSVWTQTATILCSAAPEGETLNADADAEDEINAPPALQGVASTDGANPAEQVSTAYNLAHQASLSYSWRGMKEASSLLSTLIVTSSRWDSSIFEQFWPSASLNNIGQLYLTWLQNIRHRGAFTTIYPTFASVAAVIERSREPRNSDLPVDWLGAVIANIKEHGADHSTTRRSAGWGYAALALLSALPGGKGSLAISTVINDLAAISAKRSKSDEDARQVHAMNVLQCIMLDGNMSSRLLPFVGDLLRLAMSHFSSSQWSHRNAGMMLFSACCHRGLSVRHKNKDTSNSRLSFQDFCTSFPGLSDFLAHEIEAALQHPSPSSSDSETRELRAGTLFAAQIVLSRLQVQKDQPQYVSDVRMLVKVVEQSLGDPQWKIRELASRAYRSLTIPEEAEQTAVQLLQKCSTASQNDLHGRLLAIRRLLDAAGDGTEAIWTACLMVHSALLASNPCPSTRTAFLRVVILAGSSSSAAAKALRKSTQLFAMQCLEDVSVLTAAEMEQRMAEYGLPEFLTFCAQISITFSLREHHDADLTSGESPIVDLLTKLLNHPCSEVRFATLVSDQLTIAVGTDPGRVPLRLSLLKILLTEDQGHWHRVRAAELLAHEASPTILVADELSDESIGKIFHLWSTHESEAFVDALTVYCATLLAGKSRDPAYANLVAEQCHFAVSLADEWKPVDTRHATAQFLRILANQIFAPVAPSISEVSLRRNFGARVCAIDLLSDDDPFVRAEAELIAHSINACTLREVAQCNPSVSDVLRSAASVEPRSCSVSMQQMWQYMAESSSREDSSHALWADHVWDEIWPEEAVHLNKEETSAVFLIDLPNQFRDEEQQIGIAYQHAQAAVSRLSVTRLPKLQQDFARITTTLTTLAGNYSSISRIATLRAVLAFGLLRGQESVVSTSRADLAVLDREVQGLQRGLGLADFSSGTAFVPLLSIPNSKPMTTSASGTMYRIAMISDFFHPNVGGVEGHIYLTSLRLLARGHKVIIITHAYAPDRAGIRYMTGGLKVYYVPYAVIARQDTLPNFFGLLPLLRAILVRERIDIVHGHQALSSMAHEGILHARALGIKTVFTDHSLFGFADAASILTNKLLRFVLSDVDHVVCVSHTGKENTVLRAVVDPEKVSVIPNAVVSDHFRPGEHTSDVAHITIVVLSRLMYRKGIDLLIAAIPRLCAEHPDIRFLIGGDGPKRVELEQMRERYRIQDRVEMAGAIRQGDARAHLIRGQIFLNTSLTEAFGTSIVEAASAGLFVVSTRVGGIPEVLPDAMVRLADAEEDSIVAAVSSALLFIRSGAHDPHVQHNIVRSLYTWDDVAARLEGVYARTKGTEIPSFTERLHRYYRAGPVAGPIFCIVATTAVLFLNVLQYIWPDGEIDIAAELRMEPPDIDRASVGSSTNAQS